MSVPSPVMFMIVASYTERDSSYVFICTNLSLVSLHHLLWTTALSQVLLKLVQFSGVYVCVHSATYPWSEDTSENQLTPTASKILTTF